MAMVMMASYALGKPKASPGLEMRWTLGRTQGVRSPREREGEERALLFACSITDSATRYGRGGSRFESWQANQRRHQRRRWVYTTFCDGCPLRTFTYLTLGIS